MSKQLPKRALGRPPIYEESRKPVTVYLPLREVHYIDAHCDNRTAWIIAAIQEKREREQRGTDMVQ